MKGARRTRKPRKEAGFADLMTPASPPRPVPGVITGFGATSRSPPRALSSSTRSAASSPPRHDDDDWGELLSVQPRRRLSPQKPIIRASSELHQKQPAKTTHSSPPKARPLSLAPQLFEETDVQSDNRRPASLGAQPRQSIPLPAKSADAVNSQDKQQHVSPSSPPPSAAFEQSSFAPVPPSTKPASSTVPAFLSGWDGADGWGDDPALDDSDPDSINDDAWGAWSDDDLDSLAAASADAADKAVTKEQFSQPSPILNAAEVEQKEEVKVGDEQEKLQANFDTAFGSDEHVQLGQAADDWDAWDQSVSEQQPSKPEETFPEVQATPSIEDTSGETQLDQSALTEAQAKTVHTAITTEIIQQQAMPDEMPAQDAETPADACGGPDREEPAAAAAEFAPAVEAKPSSGTTATEDPSLDQLSCLQDPEQGDNATTMTVSDSWGAWNDGDDDGAPAATDEKVSVAAETEPEQAPAAPAIEVTPFSEPVTSTEPEEAEIPTADTASADRWSAREVDAPTTSEEAACADAASTDEPAPEAVRTDELVFEPATGDGEQPSEATKIDFQDPMEAREEYSMGEQEIRIEAKPAEIAETPAAAEWNEFDSAADAWGGWDDGALSTTEVHPEPAAIECVEEPKLEKEFDEATVVSQCHEPVNKVHDCDGVASNTLSAPRTFISPEEQKEVEPNTQGQFPQENGLKPESEAGEAGNTGSAWGGWDLSASPPTEQRALAPVRALEAQPREAVSLDQDDSTRDAGENEPGAGFCDALAGDPKISADNDLISDGKASIHDSHETDRVQSGNFLTGTIATDSWSGWDDVAMPEEALPMGRGSVTTKTVDAGRLVESINDEERRAASDLSKEDEPDERHEGEADKAQEPGDSCAKTKTLQEVATVKNGSMTNADVFGNSSRENALHAKSTSADPYNDVWSNPVPNEMNAKDLREERRADDLAREASSDEGVKDDGHHQKACGQDLSIESGAFPFSGHVDTTREPTAAETQELEANKLQSAQTGPVQLLEGEGRKEPLWWNKENATGPGERTQLHLEAGASMFVPERPVSFDDNVFTSAPVEDNDMDTWDAPSEEYSDLNDLRKTACQRATADGDQSGKDVSEELDSSFTALVQDDEDAAVKRVKSEERTKEPTQTQRKCSDGGMLRLTVDNGHSQSRSLSPARPTQLSAPCVDPPRSESPAHHSPLKASEGPVVSPWEETKPLDIGPDTKDFQDYPLKGDALSGPSHEDDGWSTGIRSTDVDVSSTIAGTDVPSVAAPSLVGDSDWESTQQTTVWDAYPSPNPSLEQPAGPSASSYAPRSRLQEQVQNDSAFVVSAQRSGKDYNQDGVGIAVETGPRNDLWDEYAPPHSREAAKIEALSTENTMDSDVTNWYSSSNPPLHDSDGQKDRPHGLSPKQAFATVRDEFPSSSAVGQIVPSRSPDQERPGSDEMVSQNHPGSIVSHHWTESPTRPSLDDGMALSDHGPSPRRQEQHNMEEATASHDAWEASQLERGGPTVDEVGQAAATAQSTPVVTAAPFPSGNANNYWTRKLQTTFEDTNRAWENVEGYRDGSGAPNSWKGSETESQRQAGGWQASDETLEVREEFDHEHRDRSESAKLSVASQSEQGSKYNAFAPCHSMSLKEAVGHGDVSLFAKPLSTPMAEESVSITEKGVDLKENVYSGETSLSEASMAEHENKGMVQSVVTSFVDPRDNVSDSFLQEDERTRMDKSSSKNVGTEEWSASENKSLEYESKEDLWTTQRLTSPNLQSHDGTFQSIAPQTNSGIDIRSNLNESDFQPYAPRSTASVPPSTHVGLEETNKPDAGETYDPFAPAAVPCAEAQDQSPFQWTESSLGNVPVAFNQSPVQLQFDIAGQKRESQMTRTSAPSQSHPPPDEEFSISGASAKRGSDYTADWIGPAARGGSGGSGDQDVMETQIAPPPQGDSTRASQNATYSTDIPHSADEPDTPQSNEGGFQAYAPRRRPPPAETNVNHQEYYAPKPSDLSQSPDSNEVFNDHAAEWPPNMGLPQPYAPILNSEARHTTPYAENQAAVEDSTLDIFGNSGSMTSAPAFPNPPQPPQLVHPEGTSLPAYPDASLGESGRQDMRNAVDKSGEYAPMIAHSGPKVDIVQASYHSAPAESLASVTGPHSQLGQGQNDVYVYEGHSGSYDALPPPAVEPAYAVTQGQALSRGEVVEAVPTAIESKDPENMMMPQSDAFGSTGELMDSGATLDPSIYSYPFSIMDATTPGDLDYRPPRPVISWGFGGQLLTVLPYAVSEAKDRVGDAKADADAVSSSVRLYELSGASQEGSNDDWIAAAEAIPPPALPVQPSDLLPYAEMCDRLSKCSAGLQGSDAESRAALWRLLALMCRNSSSDWRNTASSAISGPSSVPMFERNNSASFLSGHFAGESPLKPSNLTSRRSELEQCEAAAEVERLVTLGQGSEAIRVAQGAGLWSLALVLAATLDKDMYMNLITDFAKTALNDGCALQTLFFSMAENETEILRKATSVSGLNEWRKTVAMLLTNRRSTMGSDPEKGERFLQIIGKVGDALIAQRGDTVAGHVCHLISGRISELGMGSVSLLSGETNLWTGGSRSAGSAAAVLQSLVYEAIVNSQTGKSFPHLLPFRLVLAEEIAAVGRPDVALAHCECMAAAVRGVFDSGRTDVAARSFTPPFLASLESLDQRLRAHLGLEHSKEKVGKLTALGRSLTSVFSRSSGDLKADSHDSAPKMRTTSLETYQDPQAETPTFPQPTGFAQGVVYSQQMHKSPAADTAPPPAYGVPPQLQQGQQPISNWQRPGLPMPQPATSGDPVGDQGQDGGKKESGSKRWNEFVSKTIGVLAPADGDLSPPPRPRAGQSFPAQVYGAPSIGLGPGTGSRAPGHELDTTHMRSQSMGDVPMGMLNSADTIGTPSGFGFASHQGFGNEYSSTAGPPGSEGLHNFNGVAVQERSSVASDSDVAHGRSASDMTVASQTSERRPPRPPRRSAGASASTSALESSSQKKEPVAKGWRARFSEKILSAFRGPPRAHMGSENKFVFDKERGRWIIEGEEPEEEDDVPPPPPDDDTMFGGQAHESSSTASFENLQAVNQVAHPIPRPLSMQETYSSQPLHEQSMDGRRPASYNSAVETVSSTRSFDPFFQSNTNSQSHPLRGHSNSIQNMNTAESSSETSATSVVSAPVPMVASNQGASAAPAMTGNKFRASGVKRAGRRAYVDTFNKGATSASAARASLPGRPAAPVFASMGGSGSKAGVKIFTPNPVPRPVVDESVPHHQSTTGAVSTSSTQSVDRSSETDQNHVGGMLDSSRSPRSQMRQYVPPSPGGPRMMA